MANFKGGAETKPCPLCKETLDTQQHSLHCKVILENIEVDMEYSEIFFLKDTAKSSQNLGKHTEVQKIIFWSVNGEYIKEPVSSEAHFTQWGELSTLVRLSYLVYVCYVDTMT